MARPIERGEGRFRLRADGPEIRAAEKTIKDAEARRADIALDVLTGKSSAADLNNHRYDLEAAHHAVVDKRAIADAARGELARAEERELQEKKDEALKSVKVLMRRRIIAAERFDSCAKDLNLAFTEYENLGAEILNTPHVALTPPGVTTMGLVESVRNHARVLEAFPACVEKLIPNVPRSDRRGPLQNSERAQWRSFIGS